MNTPITILPTAVTSVLPAASVASTPASVAGSPTDARGTDRDGRSGGPVAPASGTGWIKALIFLVVILAPFFIYFATARSMVAIWDSSETFAHGYIILPISLWLIWKRRDEIARLPALPWWPGMVMLLLCGFGWLLAELADVQVVRQYAFVAMLPLTVLALLGWRIALSLCFPLLFLMLAVPFGEIFVDPLINHTADFTVMALQATGIPVLREGNFFSLPTGNWSVVEACSGLRYLIASITLGLLYAYLTYRSTSRRLLFVLVSIVVPIVANWLRAYMIVMIGHLSGMELATGVDHIIYGWLFFGLVMFLMFWIGSFWREDPSPATVAAAPADAASGPSRRSPAWPAAPSNAAAARVGKAAPVSTFAFSIAALATVGCIALWPLYERYIDGLSADAPAVDLSLLDGSGRGGQANTPVAPADSGAAATAPGTVSPAAPFTDWQPAFFPAQGQSQRFYRVPEGAAGLSLLYYRNAPRGAGLISSSNSPAPREGDGWRIAGSAGRSETFDGRTLALRESRLRKGQSWLLVWDTYWIDGRFTTNNYLGKLLQAKGKLLLHGDDAASVQAFAAYQDDPEQARRKLRQLLAAKLGVIETTLAANQRNAGRQP